MFKIKYVYLGDLGESVIVKDGIEVPFRPRTKNVISSIAFWGDIIITHSNHLRRVDDNTKVLLEEVDDYVVNNKEDGYIELNVMATEPSINNTLEGYIVVIESSPTEILTNGHQLFKRDPLQTVTVLTNGNYLEIFGNRFEVIDNRLVLIV